MYIMHTYSRVVVLRVCVVSLLSSITTVVAGYRLVDNF